MTPSKLDVVIFISPNTATETNSYEADEYPWLGKYPYWARKFSDPLKKGHPLPLGQTYMTTLVNRYLFGEMQLARQLAATKRQAVLLFPIQPYGEWGPFGQIAGLARLVAEVIHYMHRTGHTDGGNQSRDLDVAPPSPRYRIGRNGYHQPPPSLRRVVVCANSAGMLTVSHLLGTQPEQKLLFNEKSKASQEMAKRITHELWGADVAPFLRVWKEVWDFDAEHEARDSLDRLLPGWMTKDRERVARCYQTAYTGSKGWIDKTPMKAFAPGPTQPGPAGQGEAGERHTERCSLVYWGGGYLKNTSAANEAPAFWTAGSEHNAVPPVAFGHALGLSGLAKI